MTTSTVFSILPRHRQILDQQLFKLLRGTALARDVQVLYVVGAHKLDEIDLLMEVFPRLTDLVVFEPLADAREALQRLKVEGVRLSVHPYAVCDIDGVADFHVSSNDGESSSLLPMGSHREHFPEVGVNATIRVQTCRLDTFREKTRSPLPQAMIVDVQGAEYRVLSSLSAQMRLGLLLVYTETSTEEIYEGSRPLADLEALLQPDLVNVGFAPIFEAVPTHGNAVFVNHGRASDLARLTMIETGRRVVSRIWQRATGR